jgi:Holliday junction resolvase RusA-like endonuclease
VREVIERWRDRLDTAGQVIVNTDLRAVSKERPRVGKSGHIYTPKRTVDFERAVAEACTLDSPVTYPVSICINIVEAPPKTWPVEKRQLALGGLLVPTRGDLDNQVKAITDGLNGIAYIDDVQITAITALREYGTTDRITVSIKQQGLSPIQLQHAVASLKAHNDEQGSVDRSGT